MTEHGIRYFRNLPHPTTVLRFHTLHPQTHPSTHLKYPHLHTRTSNAPSPVSPTLFRSRIEQ
ncbi:unnamed protein product [Penicillium roqueforti FM164]|uniref:Uncharacterized protein n=1 Tax=Penicillium roqueforti (strain FM164) TaxID=1365484 RepID=W6QRS5_PENRF|nr:unnamed protein product [Penicillium roqueforti FM164]